MSEELKDYITYLSKAVRSSKCSLVDENKKMVSRLIAQSYGVDPDSKEVMDYITTHN